MVRVLGERGYLGSVVKRRWLERGDTDHVINCIRPDDPKTTEGLARWFKVIQPSSDAIDEQTPYGDVKRKLEHIPGIVIIRAGIVDTRHEYPIAYLDWFCNPLTPLEWADYAYDHRDEPGLHITGREPLSRYNVAVMVADVFGKPTPKAARVGKCDRVQARGDWPPLHGALVEYREWLRS